MNVRELIEALKEFDPETRVLVADTHDLTLADLEVRLSKFRPGKLHVGIEQNEIEPGEPVVIIDQAD